jgi:hypothetical protein
VTVSTIYDTLLISSGRTPRPWTHLIAVHERTLTPERDPWLAERHHLGQTAHHHQSARHRYPVIQPFREVFVDQADFVVQSEIEGPR